MDYNEVLETARTKIGTKCKACPICNGVACRNTMPGPGAKGIGDTALSAIIRNGRRSVSIWILFVRKNR